MDLSPGENAVLGQIRVLYSTTLARDQPFKALTAQWPPMHYEAYRKAYAGLLAKRLVQATASQIFTITDAGLQAIGVAPAKPRARGVDEQGPTQTEPRPGQRLSSPDTSRRRGNALSRLLGGLLRART